MKRDCYDTFSGSQEEKNLLAFCKLPLQEQFDLLVKQTENNRMLQECILSAGLKLGLNEQKS